MHPRRRGQKGFPKGGSYEWIAPRAEAHPGHECELNGPPLWVAEAAAFCFDHGLSTLHTRGRPSTQSRCPAQMTVPHIHDRFAAPGICWPRQTKSPSDSEPGLPRLPFAAFPLPVDSTWRLAFFHVHALSNSTNSASRPARVIMSTHLKLLV
ncbi:hypothetical protein ACJQWK_06678 [Exserohilum turcicum]